MLYVYGALMPVRALEEVRFWKMQEREHTVVIRTLVPDLEKPFVNLLAEWESVFEHAEIAAGSILEAVIRGGLTATPAQHAEISQLLGASAAQSQEFIHHLMRMEQESRPIRTRPVVKSVIEHIIRESGYFLGVLQAGDPIHEVHPPVPLVPNGDIRNGLGTLTNDAIGSMDEPVSDEGITLQKPAQTAESPLDRSPGIAAARDETAGDIADGLARMGMAVNGAADRGAIANDTAGPAVAPEADAHATVGAAADRGANEHATVGATADRGANEHATVGAAAHSGANVEVVADGIRAPESYKEYSMEEALVVKQDSKLESIQVRDSSQAYEGDRLQKAYLHSREQENPQRVELNLTSITGEGTWTGALPDSEAVPIGGHRLPPLPYAYNALEPHIDEATMRLHHDKHHRSYVDGLNRAEKKLAEARESGDFSLVKHWERELAFHGAGHYLHTLFWSMMSPKGGGRPGGNLGEHIDRCFGSFERFRNHFSEAANQVEGGGWALLVWSPRSHRMEIMQAEKHQNLSQQDSVPLLPLDVWEHSYYLKYRNERPKYIAAWWNVVNWPSVAERFAKAQQLQWVPY